MAGPLLALAAIFPLLRFHKLGWMLAVTCLTFMAVREGISLAQGAAGWRASSAFLVVHLVGLAYLLWIVPEFWPRHAEAEPAAPSGSGESAESPASSEAVSAQAASAQAAYAESGSGSAQAADATAVSHALASIHHRIVAAGSACAVAAEAGRYGVTPAALRTEGLALYRTFLDHFLSDGPLSPDEERELICLERALDLDDHGVWRMRREAGLAGGPVSTAPILSVLSEAVPEAVPEAAGDPGDDDRPQLAELPPAPVGDRGAPVDDGPPPMASAAAPDPPAQADIMVPEPRIHSPGAFAGTTTPSNADFVEMPSIEQAGFTPGDPDRLADYEEHELGALLAWAGIPSLPPGSAPRAALERLRALHRTSTEPLEACASDQPLEPGESCLAIRTVELYRVPPGSTPAGALPDLPGPVLDPRSLVDGTPETERDLAGFARTGVCRFVLTERRLLLVAPSGQNSPLPVSRVRAVRPFRNGLEVQPQRGSPVFLAFTGGVDDVAMRIDRAARDLHA